MTNQELLLQLTKKLAMSEGYVAEGIFPKHYAQWALVYRERIEKLEKIMGLNND